MFSKVFICENFDSNAEKEVYQTLKSLEHELGAIVVLHPKIRDKLIGYKAADLAIVHGNFGIILCEVKGISEKNLSEVTSIINGKIYFKNGKKMEDPWEQVSNYRNLLIKSTKNKYYVAKKVILPYITSRAFKKSFPNLYNLYKDDTIFKEDLERNNFEKLFTGIPTDVSLNKEDIRYLCSSIGVKLDEDKINNISVYKLTTPTGIYYYDKKVLSILKGYDGGLKIIRGLAGTGKTVVLIQFIYQRATKLREMNKKAAILCFNEPLQKYILEVFKNLNISDVVEVRRINKNKHPESQNLLFPYEQYEYVLIDEFQDFPANIGRYIVTNHENVIIFVDETQKIYDEGFDKWKNALGKKFRSGLLNNYLRIIYRNPTLIYECGKEILSYDKGLKGYLKVQEVLKNSHSINEMGGLSFYSDLKTLISMLNDNLTNKDNSLNIGIFINESKEKEAEFKRKINNQILNLPVDVKSYLRVKGLEYDIIILEDFWEFLKYYNSNFSYIYRMAYTVITRSKFGVFIPYPTFNIQNQENHDIKNIFSTINKYSNNIKPEELILDIVNHYKLNNEDSKATKENKGSFIKDMVLKIHNFIGIVNNYATFIQLFTNGYL